MYGMTPMPTKFITSNTFCILVLGVMILFFLEEEGGPPFWLNAPRGDPFTEINNSPF